MTVALREGTPADYAEVASLLEQLELPLAGVPRDLAGFVVAEDAGRVVGAAAVELYGGAALLRSVAVDPGYRGHGLGSALVEQALQRAGAAGANDVFLLTTTAEQYFPRHGFTVASRDDVPDALKQSEEFRGACPASAVLMRRRFAQPLRVLVLCTGNSARSQIAEALLQHRGKGVVAAASAGARPAPRVHPLALEVLRAHGIEWAERAPRSIDAVAHEPWDYVITVCDHAREACPVLPGRPVAVHWGLSDPARVEGTDAERRGAFEETYGLLERLIDRFLSERRPRSPAPA